MPKTLPERFVQNAVAERLNREYYRRKPAYVTTEAYTRLKRADVLIAFLRAPNRPYTVVVEAKSRTTIHQLKLKADNDKVRRTGKVITVALIVGASLIAGYQWYFNAVNTLLLLSVFLLGSTLITALIRRLELSWLGSVSAIEQLGRYPANESWIAVGEDTFAKPDEYKTLVRQCKKSGVGLIVVDEKGKLDRICIPRPRHAFNDYLSRYGKRESILKKIERGGDYGPTPPERAQNLRRGLNVVLILAFFGLIATIFYEENYGRVVPDPFVRTPDSVRIAGPDAPLDLPTDTPTPATSLDCGALVAARNEQKFIVADAILPEAEARRRLSTLMAAGLRGHRLVPAPCLNSWPEADRFVVYTGATYPNLPRAEEAARAYRGILEQLRVSEAYGKAVMVR